MKKLMRAVVSIILCLSLLIAPHGAFAGTQLDETSSLTRVPGEEAPTVEDADVVRGTTPRPGPKYPSTLENLTTLSQSITPSMKTTAEGVYSALLAAPVEIFDWTNRGIVESTRMHSTTEFEYVARLAREVTSDCNAVNEKIRAVAEYLAKNIGYDNDYYTHGTHPYPPVDPYTVLQNGYTVCTGYAKTYEAMLQSLGIPCVYVYSPDHEWNAVYNGERWMLIDVTWMTNSNYEYERLWKSNVINEEWYDFTFEKALSNYNHVIEEAALGVVDGVLVAYPVYSELPDIYWPEGITGIGNHVFRQRGHFTGDLSIPDTVKTIGYASFYDCDGFSGDLKLPASLVSTDHVSFYDCDGFTGRIIFGESLKTVGTWSFASSGFSGDLILPDSLQRIEENAFYYSKFSGTLDLGEGVKYIGEDVFAGDTLFRGDLIIPDSVTEIGALAFSGCGFDGVIKIGEGVKTIGMFAFDGCSNLKGDLIIPDSVTSIGVSAFSLLGITGNIVVGGGLKKIPRDAFYGARNAKGDIIISAGVESIGERAFLECDGIDNVYFMGNAPTVFEAGDGTSSFGRGAVTLNYQLGTTGWTDSENYNAEDGTWMGYPLSVWDSSAEPKSAKISGFVKTYNPSVSTDIALVRDGEIIYSYTIVSTDGMGQITQEFILSDVERGYYDLVVTKVGHLSYTVEGIEIDGEDVALDFVLALITGDVNGDGRVDLKDITALTSTNTYGLSYDMAETKTADVNGDRCFDLKDLSIITSETNYGKAPVVVEY